MDTLPDTPAAELRPTLDRLRAAWQARRPDRAQRRDDLRRLRDALRRRLHEMADAVAADFGHRSRHETLLADGMTVLAAIDHLRSHLHRWMKPQRVGSGWRFWPARAEIRREPLGVVGVISPWNYPVNLALVPLATAIAAGNHVYLKPSEYTPRTAAFLRSLLAEVFPGDRVAVATGGPDLAAAFAALPFDHLVFTGSTAVGRRVMAAAAANLVPVTLELGGKSPAIVSADVPLKDAAERIAFGKTLNAGQTCVAPDYVLVPKDRVEDFVTAFRQAVRRFYPTLADNPDYTAIINERQFERLNGYLRDAESKGARILPLFEENPQGRRLPLAVLLDVSDDMQVMQEEIFGPLLPIVPYERLEDAFAYVNDRPRPLALYFFGYDKAEQQRVLYETHAGGVCINDTLMHVAQEDLPFGGIGPSGMGQYHGHEGFLTFSKAKAVFVKQRFNAAALIYPPYGKALQKLVYRLFVH